MAAMKAMAASERLALIAHFPDLGRALQAADRLLDEYDELQRIEAKHINGEVGDDAYKKAEGRFKSAGREARAANQIWRDARRDTK